MVVEGDGARLALGLDIDRLLRKVWSLEMEDRPICPFSTSISNLTAGLALAITATRLRAALKAATSILTLVTHESGMSCL